MIVMHLGFVVRSADFTRLTARLRLEADATWVAGVALLVIAGAAALDRSNGPSFVRGVYVALIGAVGASAVVVALAERRHWVPQVILSIKIFSMLAAAIIAGRYVLVGGGLVVAALAAVQATTIGALKWRRQRDAGTGKTVERWRRLPLDWLICLAAWTAASHLLFWNSMPLDIPTSGLFSSDYSLAAMLKSISIWVAAVAVLAAVGVPVLLVSGRRTRGWLAWAERLGFALAIVILAWLAFDTFSLFNGAGWPFYHWSLFVGPAEMVRQGHWLLWDVPSEYGFLSTLAIAAFPLSVWQALFVLNACASLAEGTIVFLVLRRLGGGIIGLAVATVLVVAAMFWRAGSFGTSLGPDVWPSTGGYRFLWVAALLGLSASLGLGDLQPRSRSWHHTLGDCIYVVGVLWSFESAVFCTAVWLPTCALVGWATASSGVRAHLARAAGFVAIPLVLAGATVGGITVLYLVILGHAPEFMSLVELNGYVYVQDLVRGGPGWGLVLAFVALSLMVAPVLKAYGLGGPTIALTAAWTALVCTALYFVIEPWFTAVYATAPIWVMGLAVAVIVSRRHPDHARLSDVVVLLTAPLLAALIIGSFAQGRNVWTRVTANQSNRVEIARGLPRVDEDLQALIRAAGLTSTDRVAYYGCARPTNGMMAVWTSADSKEVTEQQNWLPIDPKDSFGPLSRARQDVYLARWASRRQGGWLIQCKAPLVDAQADPQIGDLESRLSKDYFPDAELEDGRWRMTRYQPK